MTELSNAPLRASPEMRATRITGNQSTLPKHEILRGDLSRLPGINSVKETTCSERQLLDDLTKQFTSQIFDAKASLEVNRRPWSNVYFFERGGVHAFSGNRTKRNTLCLSTVTPCTVWTAPFSAFRSVIQAQGRAHWPGFALVLVEEHPDLLERAPHSGQTVNSHPGWGLSPQRSQGLKGRTASTPIINERFTRSLTVRLSRPKTGGSNGQ